MKEVMREFVANFVFVKEVEFSKIQLIKVIRLMVTNIGLREAKEFVEERILPNTRYDDYNGFRLRLTEAQLGRYLIYTTAYENEATDIPLKDKQGFFLADFKELDTSSFIDLTRL